jgi:hypothetical protein
MLINIRDSVAQTPSDYLVLQNIGVYHNSGKGKCGKGSGVIATTGHFDEDHNDLNCRSGFYNMQLDLAVSVQVTKHSGSDSDKWLLHEVEDGYRDNDDSDGRIGRLSGAGVKIRDIGGSKFIYWGLGGGSYTWISGQKVIEIKYTDLQRTKPEPSEVIQAYLQKHPSTIPATLILDKPHDVQWIKDEMERRLWLCDKWFMQLQLGKADQKTVLQESVKSMNVFLDYREKYLKPILGFKISTNDEKNLLANYLAQNNGTGIKNKLAEFKKWWGENKGKSINLP